VAAIATRPEISAGSVIPSIAELFRGGCCESLKLQHAETRDVFGMLRLWCGKRLNFGDMSRGAHEDDVRVNDCGKRNAAECDCKTYR
jgi:hypothetical protein